MATLHQIDWHLKFLQCGVTFCKLPVDNTTCPLLPLLPLPYTARTCRYIFKEVCHFTQPGTSVSYPTSSQRRLIRCFYPSQSLAVYDAPCGPPFPRLGHFSSQHSANIRDDASNVHYIQHQQSPLPSNPPTAIHHMHQQSAETTITAATIEHTPHISRHTMPQRIKSSPHIPNLPATGPHRRSQAARMP